MRLTTLVFQGSDGEDVHTDVLGRGLCSFQHSLGLGEQTSIERTGQLQRKTAHHGVDEVEVCTVFL